LRKIPPDRISGAPQRTQVCRAAKSFSA